MRFSGPVMKFETTEEKVQKRNAYLKAMSDLNQALLIIRQAQVMPVATPTPVARPTPAPVATPTPVAKKAFKFVIV